MVAQALDEFCVVGCILAWTGLHLAREIVGAQINHYELWFVGLKLIGGCLLVVEYLGVAVKHRVVRPLFLVIEISHDTLSGMCLNGIVGIEIACYDTGISMVHVLCLNTEMFLLCGRIRAIAAGIAVAIHFNHTSFGGNGC